MEVAVKMEKVFGIIPASSGPYMFIWIFSIVIALIIAGVIGLLISFGYQARHASFTLSDQGLRISPGLYSRLIPREDINAEGVKVINLNIETGYKPKWRTNGAGLPGYAAGWFKLENKEKALLFVTDRSSVVYIPTKKDYSVMLSVKEAGEFADLIKHWQ
jgi:hypothetical protein